MTFLHLQYWHWDPR